MQAQHLLSDLQLSALRIGWEFLACDEEVDGLTNELLADYFPLFHRHRRELTPQYLAHQDRDLRQQLQLIATDQQWSEEEGQSWYAQRVDNRIRFRDLLGNRMIYPGRLFNRKAIGEDICEAAFSEMTRGLHSLARRDLIRLVGNVGYVLTEEGIRLSQSMFPELRPHHRGQPLSPLDDLSIRRIMASRRSQPLRLN